MSRRRAVQSPTMLVVVLASLLILAGCAPQAWTPGSDRWIIATTNFSETNLVAQMYAQSMTAAGLEVEIKQLTNRAFGNIIGFYINRHRPRR